MPKFDEAYQRMQTFGTAMLSRLSGYKKEIDDIRQGRVALAQGCPSRASAAHTFLLAKIQQDLDEVNAAMKDAVTELRRECGDEASE